MAWFALYTAREGTEVAFVTDLKDERKGSEMMTQIQRDSWRVLGAPVRFAKRIGQKGISLLEVMVTMLILAVGILGLVPLIGISIYNNTYSYDVTSADALARQRIESLLDIPDYGALPYWVSEDSVGGQYAVYSQVDDNTISAAVPAGLFRISVSVSWTDGESEPRTLNYSTFKPKF
ncbi:MAG: prepilin-type N-terminal cleavage/methylation domain-containing protein [Candidatus Zixiibacteriota bacterium]